MWGPNHSVPLFLHSRNAHNPPQAKVRSTYLKPSVEEGEDGLDSSTSIRSPKESSMFNDSSRGSPFPRPNKSVIPNHPVAPKPNPTSRANRNAKEAENTAEQWEKAKEDAEAKSGAFRGWEQMESTVNQQNFREPLRPKPPPNNSGFTPPATTAALPSEAAKPKRSWEPFPGSHPSFLEWGETKRLGYRNSTLPRAILGSRVSSF